MKSKRQKLICDLILKYEIETQEEFSIFTYHLAPDYDFRQDILSFGDKVEVLEPEELRNRIKLIILNQIIHYDN